MLNRPEKPAAPRGAAPAFTLVELMVTIAIIAVLVVISLFGYMKYRSVADKAVSVGNLRQLQLANAGYAGDNNGSFVPITENDDQGNQTRWFVNPKYVQHLTGEVTEDGKAGQIPLSLMDPKVLRAGNEKHDRIYASYGMNANGLTLGSIPNLSSKYRMSLMTDPGRSMAFASATDFRINYPGRFKWDFDNPNDSKTSGGELAYRHGDKIQVVYFDGRVSEMSKADLEEIDSSRRGRNGIFWNPLAQ